MSGYYLGWLAANTVITVGSVVVIGVGAYLLRPALGELSDSISLRPLLWRIAKLVPGSALMVFGCIMIWKVLGRVIGLPLPG